MDQRDDETAEDKEDIDAGVSCPEDAPHRHIAQCVGRSEDGVTA
jgi:hypothetical protein